MKLREFAVELGVSEDDLIQKFAQAGIDKMQNKNVSPIDKETLIKSLNVKNNKPKLSLRLNKDVTTKEVADIKLADNKIKVSIKKKKVLNKPPVIVSVAEDSDVELPNTPELEVIDDKPQLSTVEKPKVVAPKVKKPSKMKVMGLVEYDSFIEDEIAENVSIDILKEAERQIKHQGKLNNKKNNTVSKPISSNSTVDNITIQEFKKPVQPKMLEIVIPDVITVNELAHKLSIKISVLMKMLMKIGVICSMNQALDQETALLIVEELGHKSVIVKTEEDRLLESISEQDYNQNLIARAPVVTMMGHVDHGKTSLLDYIRKSKVVAKEVGGITQHVGAYHVETDNGMITFLDTPGHEAFTALRARGAKVTDIVVLVVAADDGIMPQTLEAFQHAQAAKVPIVMAINKIDKPGADLDKVKQQLLSNNIIIEEFGGDIMSVPISAKTGQGVTQLLEAILLQAEMLELKANQHGLAKGVVIESKLDKGRGVVIDVLVQSGQLKKGDIVITGVSCGRVRAMLNENGKNINQAGASIPVQILGLTDLPQAGDEVVVVKDEKKAREIASSREHNIKQKLFARQQQNKLNTMFDGEKKTKSLAVIVKADTQGSYEAIAYALQQLSTEKVKVNLVYMAVGGINESDVNLAIASNAIVFGFNVRADNNAKKLATTQNIDIHYDNIIYDILGKVKISLLGMTPKEKKEYIIGSIEIREVFTINKNIIAGAFVIDGIVKNNSLVRVVRDSIVIFSGAIASLRRFKDEVKEVKQGYECGLTVTSFTQLQVNDMLEVYEIQEVALDAI